MEKANEGYVIALNAYTKWRENTTPTNHTHYLSYSPKQEIGIRNPLYDNFSSTDIYSPTQLRFAEIFPTKKDAEKLISFLTNYPEILKERSIFYPMPNDELNLRVQKVAIQVIEE